VQLRLRAPRLEAGFFKSALNIFVVLAFMKQNMGNAAMTAPAIEQRGIWLARLLPALYLMLLVGWFSRLPEFREGLFWHLAFLSNIYMAFTGEWAGHLSQMWSLSMQEQFYLLWPLIFFLPARWLGYAMAGIVSPHGDLGGGKCDCGLAVMGGC